LGDCRSIMEFTVVDCVSPAPDAAAAAAYDNKFISNILSVAHKYRDKRRRLYGTKHYPPPRERVGGGGVLFFNNRPENLFISAACQMYWFAHTVTAPAFINRKGFNLTTCR